MHPDYHYSDIMRALVAYKFGGIYSDLDIVTLKPLPDELPANFMVADVSRRLGNCFFKFEKGHPFLEKLMRDIVSTILICILKISLKYECKYLNVSKLLKCVLSSTTGFKL